MRKNKSSISKASSYEDIGTYWDTQDLSKVWHKTRKVKFDVQIGSEVIYYPTPLSIYGYNRRSESRFFNRRCC